VLLFVLLFLLLSVLLFVLVCVSLCVLLLFVCVLVCVLLFLLVHAAQQEPSAKASLNSGFATADVEHFCRRNESRKERQSLRLALASCVSARGSVCVIWCIFAVHSVAAEPLH